MTTTRNPFAYIATHATSPSPRIALALASCFAAVHLVGHDRHESLSQLYAACRAVSILDKDLYALGACLSWRAFEEYWTEEGSYELSEHALPELQDLACEYLGSLSEVAS